QDISVEKRRKTLRRVSFANTIEVFERDLKNTTTESAGMNTLLHAPIQASVQQTEGHDADSALPGTNGQNSTVLFSEENEMDMTSSHTAVITRNLTAGADDNTEKIDITSFLAGLNSTNAKAETSKELPFFSDHTNLSRPPVEQKEDATAVKKINLNEFLMSLKSTEKAPNPAEGPEKENVLCVPSQVSEDVTRSSEGFVYSREPLDTCNVTKVFRGQDDEMEMTKCHSLDARAVFSAVGSISSETVFRGDQAVVSSKSDDMDITGNYTDMIYNDSTKEMKSCQNSDRQEKTHVLKVPNKMLPTRVDPERDFSVGGTASSEEGLKTPLSADGLSLWGTEEPPRATLPEPHRGFSIEKPVVFPSAGSTDLTGNCVVMVPDAKINAVLSERKAVPGTIAFPLAEDMEITRTHTAVLSGAIGVQDREAVPTIPAVPADRTLVLSHNRDDMEMTASHTIAVNDIKGFGNQE
ncbi:KNL1 protein, partial [Galbula dea]|nr:KNL1 protein [Galbula dea]